MWSMGCILYELVTLERAFQASNLGTLVLKIIEGRYKPPTECNDDVREIIELLLDVCSSKRPSAGMILQHALLQSRLLQFLETSSVDYSEKHSASMSAVSQHSKDGIQNQNAREDCYQLYENLDTNPTIFTVGHTFSYPTAQKHGSMSATLGKTKIINSSNRTKAAPSKQKQKARGTEDTNQQKKKPAMTKTRLLRNPDHVLVDREMELAKSNGLSRQRQQMYDKQQRLHADEMILKTKKHAHRIKNAKPKICVEDIQRLKRENKMAKATDGEHDKNICNVRSTSDDYAEPPKSAPTVENLVYLRSNRKNVDDMFSVEKKPVSGCCVNPNPLLLAHLTVSSIILTQTRSCQQKKNLQM